MFFIGIFGVEEKEKEIKTIKNIPCSICDFEDTLRLYKRYSFFHLFFIPLFKWNEEYYIICTRCGGIFEISREKGSKLEQNPDETLSYWDMRPVSQPGSIPIICRHCGRTLDEDFEFCPYCGHRR